jgi:DNA repair exonuclease SbcCD ATPase subunit
MNPEEQKRWQELDDRLTAAEKRLQATANLVQAGIPMLVDTQIRLNALIDSDARLYGRLEQLAESQKKTDQQIADLAASVKTLVDALIRGGNGHH